MQTQLLLHLSKWINSYLSLESCLPRILFFQPLMLLNFSSQKTSPHLKSFCFFEEDDDDDFFSPQLDIRIHDDIFQSCLKKARNSRRDSCYTTLCMKNKITAHRLFSLPYFGTRNCFCFDFQQRSCLSARHYVINTILTKMIRVPNF